MPPWPLARFLPLLVVFLVSPLIASADEGMDAGRPAQPPAADLLPSLVLPPETALWQGPHMLDPVVPDLYFAPGRWPFLVGDVRSGQHALSWSAATQQAWNPFAIGERLPAASIGGSVEYRFHGLFGGIVRPVVRFSVGAGQTWEPTSGLGFSGYDSGLLAYAMPEAGLEFVYRGYGVGVTARYLYPMSSLFRTDHEKHTTSPFAEYPDADKARWLVTPYLILK